MVIMKDAIQSRERLFKTSVQSLAGEPAAVATKDFAQLLKETYPDRDYDSKPAGDRFDNFTAFISKEAEKAVGAIAGYKGLEDEKIFNATFFAVDPKYQNSNVSKDLMRTVADTFDEVYIKPLAHGQRQAQDSRYKNWQRALVIYYEKLGFKITSKPDEPIVMVWKKTKESI